MLKTTTRITNLVNSYAFTLRIWYDNTALHSVSNMFFIIPIWYSQYVWCYYLICKHFRWKPCQMQIRWANKRFWLHLFYVASIRQTTLCEHLKWFFTVFITTYYESSNCWKASNRLLLIMYWYDAHINDSFNLMYLPVCM